MEYQFLNANNKLNKVREFFSFMKLEASSIHSYVFALYAISTAKWIDKKLIFLS